MNDSESPTGAEEYLQAEIQVQKIASPAVEKEIRSALESLPGVQVLSIDAETAKATVCYDPLLTTKAGLAAAIAKEGLKTGNIHAEDASLYEHPDAG